MRLRHPAAIAALIVLAACGGGDGGPSGPSNNTTGTVRGTVSDQTGAPVVSANVALSRTGQTTRNASTGSDGGYTFSNVEAGTYTVAVTPPSGYSLGSGSGTTTVAVVAGQQAGVAVIQLTKQAPGGPAPLLAEVSMANTAFNPQSVEVRVGGSVRWTNNDNTAHNATGAGFTSTGNMNPGAAIERQMDTAGTFQYSCTLHAGMNGTIVVR